MNYLQMEYNYELPPQPLQPFTIVNQDKKKCDYRRFTLNYCNLIANIFLLTQLSIIFIIICVYANDASRLLKDAQTNMDDLSILLPKVYETLKIVEEICKAPQYAPYCHSR